jgi:hypothetical protein
MFAEILAIILPETGMLANFEIKKKRIRRIKQPI